MNRNKTKAILLGISFILLWSVTSSVSSPNAEGSPSYNDIKDIDLIGREELLHSLKVKPSFLHGIEEIEDTSKNIKYDTTYHLLDGEKKFIGMTDEEFERYFENNIESVDENDTNEYYIDTVGKRMVAGFYRLNKMGLDDNGEFKIDSNVNIIITKPIYNTTEKDFRDNDRVIYTSEVIRRSGNDSGTIIGRIHIIRNSNNKVNSVCLEEQLFNEEQIKIFTDEEIQIRLKEEDVIDQSINKIVYKVPMQEFAQFVYNQQLPMCSSATLSSVLTSYRDAYIEPYVFNKVVFPVTYETKNKLNASDKDLEMMKALDKDIEYRSFKGISVYATSDMVGNTVENSRMFTDPYTGYISAYISCIRNNGLCILSLIKNGDLVDVNLYKNLNYNNPSHVIVANGHIDSDILIGFNTNGRFENVKAKPNTFMLWLNKQVGTYMTDANLYFTGATETRLYSINDMIKIADKVIDKQNLVRKADKEDKLYNLGEMIDVEYEYYKKLDKNYVKDYTTIMQRGSNMQLLETLDLVSRDYNSYYNNIDRYINDNMPESRKKELRQYYSGINNAINGILSDKNIAGALGITEEQLDKLTSGYTPYSMSRVAQFNTSHPELLILTVLFRDTEAHMMPVENKTEKISNEEDEKELVRPDLYIGDTSIVLDDSKVIADTADNFMMECLKLRKHDATVVYRSLDSIYKAVNEKSIFGDYNLNYVILVFKHNEDRKIAVINSMLKSKNEQGKYDYHISMALLNSNDLSGVYKGGIILGIDDPEITDNKIYKIVPINVSSMSEFSLGMTNDAGIDIEYKFSEAISTPSKIDATIDNNFYLTTPSGPILVDLSRAK